MSPVFLFLSLTQLFTPGTVEVLVNINNEEFRLAEKKDKNVKCAVRERPSAVGTQMKEDRMKKKDKKVAYRGGDIGAGS